MMRPTTTTFDTATALLRRHRRVPQHLAFTPSRNANPSRITTEESRPGRGPNRTTKTTTQEHFLVSMAQGFEASVC